MSTGLAVVVTSSEQCLDDAWMTLGQLTIFCDCSLSTSLAHLSATVLGQAFMCAAAATLSSRKLVGIRPQKEKSGDGFPAFRMGPTRRPSSEGRERPGLRPWAPSLGVPWPRASDIVLGRSTFLLNLVDIARVRPARPDKLELWRCYRLVIRHGAPLRGFRRPTGLLPQTLAGG